MRKVYLQQAERVYPRGFAAVAVRWQRLLLPAARGLPEQLQSKTTAGQVAAFLAGC
jgi:hypothetical protein